MVKQRVQKLGRNAVFTKEQEEANTNHAKLLANLFYVLNPVQPRRIAFEFANRNEIKHNFNRDSRTAGKDWLVTFLKIIHRLVLENRRLPV
jgi:hypothetical protein